MAKKSKRPRPQGDTQAARKGKEAKDTATHPNLFEIRDAGPKGLGVFALQNIPAGTCILIEEPLILIPKDKANISPQDMLAAYRKLDATKKKQFDALRHKGHRDAEYAILQHVVLPVAMRVELQFAWNNHTVKNKHTGVNAVGAYHLSSMFNHACRPNATGNHDDDGTRKYFAHEDIAAGQEITSSYDSVVPFLGSTERVKAMSMTCYCDLCTSTSANRQVSDMRRFMSRALWVFLNGADPGQQIEHYVRTRWHRQEYVSDYMSLSPKARQQRNAVHFFVLAKLLEAEVCFIPAAIICFAVAAISLVHVADEACLTELPQRQLQNVRLWTTKSEMMAKNSGFLEYQSDHELRRYWAAMMEVLQALGPNGEIPELEVIGTHAGRMRGLKHGKGTMPVLSK